MLELVAASGVWSLGRPSSGLVFFTERCALLKSGARKVCGNSASKGIIRDLKYVLFTNMLSCMESRYDMYAKDKNNGRYDFYFVYTHFQGFLWKQHLQKHSPAAFFPNMLLHLQPAMCYIFQRFMWRGRITILSNRKTSFVDERSLAPSFS